MPVRSLWMVHLGCRLVGYFKLDNTNMFYIQNFEFLLRKKEFRGKFYLWTANGHLSNKRKER